MVTGNGDLGPNTVTAASYRQNMGHIFSTFHVFDHNEETVLSNLLKRFNHPALKKKEKLETCPKGKIRFLSFASSSCSASLVK